MSCYDYGIMTIIILIKKYMSFYYYDIMTIDYSNTLIKVIMLLCIMPLFKCCSLLSWSLMNNIYIQPSCQMRLVDSLDIMLSQVMHNPVAVFCVAVHSAFSCFL